MPPIRRRRRRRSVVRRGWWIAAGVIVALLASSVAWVVIRGLSARDELLGALPIAERVEAKVAAGDSDIAEDLAELQRRTESARASTSGPVWRIYENVPVIGQNLTAFREAAQIVDDIADEALPPLGDLADEITLASLTPRDGGIDLEPLIAARPALATAAEALVAADERAADINTEGTIGQISSAVSQLVGLISDTAEVVSGLSTAAELLPPMLGADGERTYLLLFMNNAELRAGGGIPGALSTIVVTDGRIELAEQSSAGDLGRFDPPPLPATAEETEILSIPLDRFMQNVTGTPNFARSGELAQAMWAERTGQLVDGVIGVDVGALRLLLGATGPIELASGDALRADNAVDLLLSDVYARFDNPADQDAFFAAAAQRVFETVTDLEADPARLVDALATGVREQRIVLWSDDEAEQARLAALDLTGGFPESTAERTTFGVYLNEGVGSKMSYYLDFSIAVAQNVCRNDGRPTTATTIRLRSNAPADAAQSLPRYVTGGGAFGVPAGIIRNNVHLYLPAGENVFDVRIDGESVAFSLGEHEGHVVVSRTVDLEPGELAAYTVYSNGPESGNRDVIVEHTPSIRDVPVAVGQPLDCNDIPSTPGQQTEASGAGEISALAGP
ncbi:MAG TPA: DUF4012 domain-containing protein [Microcella sp.]|nr:DUF4012 domain-containing protein [Microcella sp.]